MVLPIVLITLVVLLIVVILCCFLYCLFSKDPLDPEEYMREFIPEDIEVTAHLTRATDGYINKIFNVRNLEKIDPTKTPIYIQHGLGASSNCFLINGRKHSVAIILADRG